MERREFITLLGGAAAAWPLAARAQSADRMRHIGVLMNTDDPEGKARNAAFEQGLQKLGWTNGRNVRIDYRWGAGDVDRIRRYPAELVSLRRTSSSPLAARPRGRCFRRPAPCRSCSYRPPIRSALASSIAWRGQAAMPPALPCSNTASARNGWNYSKRSRRA
jgi:hypothetical protein